MLKVHVDQGQDYLDYLRGFILQVLISHRPDPVSDVAVRDHIRADFGLEIPERAIQVVLKRLSRKLPLTKKMGVYRITGELPDPRINAARADAHRHINAVVNGLREFSTSTGKPLKTNDEAVTAICAFLTQFNVPCLRAYLRNTAIPTIESHQNAQITIVSKYVLALQNTDPERFESFLVVVKGHMLANALLCPDLQDAPKTYKGVTFYLDTPLLIRRLGLEGQAKLEAVKCLVELLCNLGGTVATFTHLREELEHVINGAAINIESPSRRSAIVMEARQSGMTKSDLLVLMGQIDDKLKDAGISVLGTPDYIANFQIDETAFEQALSDEVSYFNPQAKAYDIDSVRGVYVLRRGTSPSTLERSKAILVTSNAGFSRAAFQYGQKHEESREVTTVVTDFSLANMAWLKAPLGAPTLPMTEVLAFSYAALQPSTELLEKYLSEIGKLEKQGRISARDHQLLRSSQLAHAELMNLTLGEEVALTEQTITETLKHVTEEIKKEESEKYRMEQIAHQETQKQLAEHRTRNESVKNRVYWRCLHRARLCAWATSGVIVLLLAGGLAFGVGLRANNHASGLVLGLATGVLLLFTLLNAIFGTTVKRLHEKMQARCLTWFIRRKAAETGLDLTA